MNKPVFWIHGNRRQCRSTWNQIVKRVEEKTGQKPNIETVYCGFNPANIPLTQRWATTNDLIHIMRTRDMFDSRPRIIKVIGLPEEYATLVNWLHLVNLNNVLVFWGPFGYVKPRTKQWLTAKNTKLFRTIQKEGRIVDHPLEALSDADAVKWIQSIVGDFKKKITSEAAVRMVELQGRNLDILENSVEKLIIYQTGKEIDLEAVNACCFSDYADNEIWSFIDHLDRQDVKSAIDFMQAFYAEDSGSVGETFYGRINKLFGALLQHYQFLFMTKDVCGKSFNTETIQKELGTFKKTTPSKLKELQQGLISLKDLENRFSSGYMEMQIRKSTFQHAFNQPKSAIYSIVSDLYNCMYWVRQYSANHAMIRLILDTFILVACGKLNLIEAAQIRGHKRKFRV